MVSQEFPGANQDPPNRYIKKRSDVDYPKTRTTTNNGVEHKTKRAYGKQQELVCVIPAITKNQSHDDTVRSQRVEKTQIVRSEEQQKPRGRTHPGPTTTRQERRNYITQKRIRKQERQPRNDRSIRKQTNTSSRRGCGTLLAYNRDEISQNRPPYGRNRPVHATDHQPRKIHTYQTKFLLYYSITSKGVDIQQN